MKLSTKSRYSVRILLELARHRDDGPVATGEISRRQQIPVKYLEQLVRTLKQADLVGSVRGPKGGHLLAVAPEKISLGQVVRLFETQTDLVACISAPEKCEMADDCKVRLVWEDATTALFEKLDQITIGDLLSQEKASGGRTRC
jgi:Rrf2 family protein